MFFVRSLLSHHSLQIATGLPRHVISEHTWYWQLGPRSHRRDRSCNRKSSRPAAWGSQPDCRALPSLTGSVGLISSATPSSWVWRAHAMRPRRGKYVKTTKHCSQKEMTIVTHAVVWGCQKNAVWDSVPLLSHAAISECLRLSFLLLLP